MKELAILPSPGVAIQPAPLLDHDGAQRLREAFLVERTNQNTRRAYAQAVADFAAFLSRRTGRQFGEAEAMLELLAAGVGAAHVAVLEYRADLMGRQLKPGTVGQRMSALREAVRVARKLGMVAWDLEVPTSKGAVAYRDTRGPGRQAVRSMLEVVEARRDARGVRDHAIMRLFADLALRRFEVSGLDLEHLDVGGGRLEVLRKGKVERIWMTLPGPTLRALEAWLAVRGSAPGPLFVGRRGQRLEVGGIYRRVRKLGLEVGEKVRPHGLRHTAITEAVKRAQAAGIGLDEVRDFSGHADVRTLMLYRDREVDMQGKIAALVAEDDAERIKGEPEASQHEHEEGPRGRGQPPAHLGSGLRCRVCR